MNPELFVTPKSTVLDTGEKQLLMREDVGGIVLFGVNLGETDDIKRLTDSIHTIREDLIIATDEEGGLVSRLYHVMRSDSQRYVALRSDQEAFDYYGARAKAMKELGFDLNLAPVVDIAPTPDSIMYKRAYGPLPSTAITFAGICIAAQKDAGLASCVKHFPGLGNSSVDSHLAIPRIDATYEQWLETDGAIYAGLAKFAPEYVMVGHVLYPKIDGHPASSSARWIKEVKSLLPNAKVLVDDVTMKAYDDATDLSTLKEYGVDGVLAKDQRHPYVRHDTGNYSDTAAV